MLIARFVRIAKWLLVSCVLASTVASAAPRRRKRSKALKKDPIDQTVVATEEEIEMPLDPAAAEPVDEPAPEVTVRKKKTKHKGPSNEFYVRAGIAHVEPRISSSGLELQPAGITKLAAPMGPTQGSIETDPANIFAAIIGFAPAFAHGYVAVETIIGIPKKTKLRATGDLANKSLAPDALGLIPTGIPPLGEELGEASAVPPMITIVARTPALGPVRFYAGGGASVLFVRDAKITNKVLTEVATPKLEIDPAFGFVAQAGIDAQIYGRFYARLDVKELWFQPAETRITNIHVRTTIPLLETVDVGSAKSQSTANPIIVQFGIGATF